jgi:hypothetical protein
MNNNGLAFIVGGLVVVVAAILYFGTGMFRAHDNDVDIKVELPAPQPAN